MNNIATTTTIALQLIINGIKIRNKNNNQTKKVFRYSVQTSTMAEKS